MMPHIAAYYVRSSSISGQVHAQEHWNEVEALLGVFRDCTDEDALAELAFPSNLSKKHRAAVHTCVYCLMNAVTARLSPALSVKSMTDVWLMCKPSHACAGWPRPRGLEG